MDINQLFTQRAFLFAQVPYLYRSCTRPQSTSVSRECRQQYKMHQNIYSKKEEIFSILFETTAHLVNSIFANVRISFCFRITQVHIFFKYEFNAIKRICYKRKYFIPKLRQPLQHLLSVRRHNFRRCANIRILLRLPL